MSAEAERERERLEILIAKPQTTKRTASGDVGTADRHVRRKRNQRMDCRGVGGRKRNTCIDRFVLARIWGLYRCGDRAERGGVEEAASRMLRGGTEAGRGADWGLLESLETIWALGWSGGRGRVVQPYVRNDDDDDGGWLVG